MMEMTLQYFVQRALRINAGRTAVIDGMQSVSYRDLDRRSDAIAQFLLDRGLARGERVAVLLHNSSDFIEVELGILKAGLIKVPINNRLSAVEIMEILTDCTASAIVLEPEFQRAIVEARSRLPELRLVIAAGSDRGEGNEGAELVDLTSVKRHASPTQLAAPAVVGTDPCVIRYSGGTTGRSKGIVHTHSSCVAIALSATREYQLGPHDVFLHVGHLSHGQNFIWPALLARGARLVMMRRFDPLQVLAHVQQHKVTRLHLVPVMMNAVFGHPDIEEYDLSSLRAVVYASAPMATEHIRRLHRRVGSRIAQTYTLSESAVITTVLRPEDHVLDGSAEQMDRLTSCGREALDVELRIVDSSMNEVAPGAIGEIAIRSPGNMLCYWKQPELTANVLKNGWILSGDMGRRDGEGYVFLVDRKDDKIITGGFNVYPREVEDVLYQHPDIREAAVVGVPDEQWGEAITAVVALQKDAQCSESDLLEYCRSRLAGYKKPKRIIIRDDLPKSPIGKILRRAVREPFWTGMKRQIN